MAVIYLIGGPPRCGKTTAAEMLSKRLQVPWIPADYVEAIVSQYIPHDHEKPYPLTHVRKTTHKNNDKFYADFSSAEIIKMYKDKARTVWPGLRAFIEYAVYEKRSFIVEGLHIDPSLIAELAANKSIACVMLYRLDEKQIEEGFQKSTESRDWVLDHTKERATFPRIAKMISEYGKIIREESGKGTIDAICMDGDFATKLTEALEVLMKH